MSKIKVAHLIGGGDTGGAKQHLLTLLSHINRELFSPMIIALGEGPLVEEAEALGIPTLILPYKAFLGYSFLNTLPSVLAKEDLHILHTHGVRANFYGRWASRRKGEIPKIVTTVHSIPLYDYANSLWGVAATIADTITRSMTDVYVAVSRAVLLHLLRRGLKLSNIEVVYNGIDETLLNNYLLTPCNPPIIGTVGRLVTVKGQIYLLEALPYILREFGKVEVRFIGDGPLKDRLYQKAKELGVDRYVVFTGRVKDVYSEISCFTVGVFPSLMEGMGLAIVETMGLGVPVVASKVGGIEEVIAHGKTGVLFSRKDTVCLAKEVVTLLKDEELRKNLGNNGRKQVLLRFNLKHMLERTEWLYQKLMEGVVIP